MSARPPRRRAEAADAPSPEAQLARRLERFLARAAVALRWSAAERGRWNAIATAAASDAGARAATMARRLERLARELPRPAEAREARRLAGLLRLRAGKGRVSGGADALATLLAALRPALAFERATAFLLDSGTGRLVPAVVEGEHIDLIPDVPFDHGAGFSSWVAKSRRPVLLSTCREDLEPAGPRRPASFLCVPLLAGDEVVGVLNLAHGDPEAFTATDRDFAVLACALAAAALRAGAAEAPPLAAAPAAA